MIKITDLEKRYDKEHVIHYPSELSIKTGEMVAIVGPSGVGKTTLLNIIGLLDRHYGGQYYLDGQDTASYSDIEISRLRNRNIGFVFQDYKLIDELTVLDNILLPEKIAKEKHKDRLQELINLFNIEDILRKKAMDLSGGQKQRAAFTRAMMMKPKLILADEPTGSLDKDNAEMVLNYLKEINQAGTTVITITHDSEIAMRHQRVINLAE